ncbi:ribosomal protein L20 [Bradyrhizobium sp. CIR48]|uniref:hypothetical protein n=1 Tax=Bradyrhizobium sp. CIR48 TaxID=2663840 RepID=UPI001605E1CA|nr:hypothetical protein [Bradyrhizobium sp. CIR48]MBB4429230.1 ribosomal protein L20 [Bradyrhizobium sp. CIR48]
MALDQLAETIFTGGPFQKATTFESFLNKLANIIMVDFRDRANVAVQAADLASIEQQLLTWLQGEIAQREFFIPCVISPWDAKPFSIGPVAFKHIRDFVPEAQAVSGSLYEVTFGPVAEQIARSGANWMATVKLDGRTKERAQEVADLAADLALTSLQLCLPEEGEHIARMTGRTMPVFRQAISRSNGQISSASTNSEPGRAFGPGFLDQRLSEAKAVLETAGRRVAAFVDGAASLSKLEMPWPDAAYWFHEGLAEPLDTIAVPKLETAIEILLRSESTKGSKARVIKAIEAFYGLSGTDFINAQSQITVEQFAQGLVRDRSRILHGTWSTLNHSLRASRPSLTTLVHGLLIAYSMELDRYAGTPGASDEIDAFLTFVNDARKNAAAAAATAPPTPTGS